MVDFKMTIGGVDVLVNGKLFGHLQAGRGFFTDSTTIKEFLSVSPADLIQIALKADEVWMYGNTTLPICQSCKGTPNFPRRVYNPNEGMQSCQSLIHPFNIRNFGRL